MSRRVLQERGRIAALTRSRTADDPELLAARRNLAAARLAEYIHAITRATPLTPGQVDELVAILRAAPTHRELAR